MKKQTRVVIKKIIPAHIDKRGSIIDILEGISIEHVGVVTFNKGSVRANHYHNKQNQYSYLLEGEVRLLTRNKSGGKIVERLTRPGDFVFIPAGFIHAYVATKKSSMVVLTNFSRNHKKYEEDTVRFQLIK